MYALPVPIWLSQDALGKAYETGLGDLRFQLHLPVAEPLGPEASKGRVGSRAPTIRGRELAELDAAIADAPNRIPAWTQRFAASIDPENEPAMALLRCVITDVTFAGTDADSSDLTYRLARSINLWFDHLRTWVEVLTGQDLNPYHRVYDAEDHGRDLTFIEPKVIGSVSSRFTTSHITPIGESAWTDSLRAVMDGRRPPLEYVLLRDAYASNLRGETRRAVLELGTATELVLSRYLLKLQQKDGLGRHQELDIGRQTLGRFVDIVMDLEVLSRYHNEGLRKFKSMRNDAAHRGQNPDPIDLAHVFGAVSAVFELVQEE